MKNQLLTTILLIVFMSMPGLKSFAYDIEVSNAEGMIIYYKWINEKTELAVTYGDYGYINNNYRYHGDIIIPETVQYDGNIYHVTSIDDYAFYGCNALTSVTIPQNVKNINFRAFYNCSGLTTLNIPKNITSINVSAFSGCYGLNSITVENGNTVYDSRNNCNAIIETASNELIYGCKNTTIPNSVTSIAESAFSGCSSLTSITIPNSVTSIGGGAFSGCSSLTFIIIPNSVTSIAEHAFYGCSSLTSITIPNSVTSIAGAAFSGCYGLNSITVENGNTIYDSRNNCNAIIETASNKLICGCKNTTIPNSVTVIGVSAFVNCSSLNTITIPNSVTVIEVSAFNGCSSLNTITIPNSVTSIAGSAFANCSSLTSITIPNSVTSIADGAFSGCISLTSITIPNSVTSIGAYAFQNCSSLNTITIPNSVTAIGAYAFIDCSSLNTITIPNSVTSIGESAFYMCSALTTVTIPNNLTSIGGNAFYGTAWYYNQPDGLIYAGKVACNYKGQMPANTHITIEDGTLGIAAYAFYGYNNLSSITIPNSVISIGSDAFYRTAWYDNQPDGLVYAGKVAYSYKGVMPANTHITIKDGTLGIADNAFSLLNVLTSISIPNSVMYIGENAFSGNKLQTVISQIEDPFSIKGMSEYNSPFSEYTFNNATLYIPSGSLEKYRAAEGWKDFSFIESVANYIHLELQGDYSVQVPIGTPYIDAGFKATINGQDASSYVVTSGLDDIDMNSIGFYDITYSVNNDGAVPVSVSRTVMVYDPSIETDLSGTWITQPGTQRIYGGETVTPFADFTCKIKKVVPGIFSVSDFFAGYYDQRAGYGGSYSCKGYLGLRADNALVCLNNGVKGWGDALDEGSFVGSYDPETETLTWQCDYANSMTFYIYLKSNDPRPTGIQRQENDAEVYPTSIYAIDGKRISKPIHGLNIIRMSDGSTKKVLVK